MSVAVMTSDGTPAATTGTVSSRNKRASWAFVGLIVTIFVVLAMVTLAQRPSTGLLDPDVADKPDGGAALSKALSNHGVEVEVISSARDLASMDLTGSTVFFARPEGVAESRVSKAAPALAKADRVVFSGATPATVDALALPVRASRSFSGASTAECTSSIARSDDSMGSVVYPRRGYRVDRGWFYQLDSADSGTSCFPGTQGRYRMIVLPKTENRAETVLLGWKLDFTNNLIVSPSTSAAGIAIRSLGASPKLVWYQPGPGEFAEAEQAATPGLQYPPWFSPLVSVLITGVVLLAIIMGRRLGRVVPEQLPVVIRAVENTESRGTMYRRSGDVGRAGTLLRAGTIDRLSSRLGVGRRDAGALVEMVAQASGVPSGNVSKLLYDPPPGSPEQLMTLANDLADLERKVRHQ